MHYIDADPKLCQHKLSKLRTNDIIYSCRPERSRIHTEITGIVKNTIRHHHRTVTTSPRTCFFIILN